ncbi:hypothetical protein B7Y94_04410 [Candidatus Saccharibacteria bacterium 32-49-12]|nr:MAG: hypothetical protein B7Y94_04410 [Candidatus Saccharibacteria bacterium 32-49-12]
MASPASAKKQIIESIKDKTNILVTVSNNPSVDELAAALGLTIFLNKLDKHATSVVSGQIPSAIDFLNPDKTFEATADSLRDFIIALDKEKADHLRYKLDGDMVKIFITPYRTTISSEDLEFSQGDYNVELVLALNVANSSELDAALTSHGKILHDATVATITAGDIKSDLGTIDWREADASGVSEMATQLVQDLSSPKAAPDEQIATALLTGIVAATERFSNEATSSRVMTIAAELMAAGANQQLIAAQLTESSAESDSSSETEATKPEEPAQPSEDGSQPITEDATQLTIDRSEPSSVGVENNEPSPAEAEPETAPEEADGSMSIEHSRDSFLDDTAKQVMAESQEDAARAAEAQLNQLVEPSPSVDESAQPGVLPPVAPDITEDLRQVTDAMSVGDTNPEIQHSIGEVKLSEPMSTPSIGGTLNATTAQAAEEKLKDESRDQNRTILRHGTPLAEQAPDYIETPMNAAMSAETQEPSVTDIFAAPPNSLSTPNDSASQLPAVEQSVAPLEPVSGSNEQESALQAVGQALSSQPVGQPPAEPTLADLEAQYSAPGLPPMPDFSSLPPLPPSPIGVDPNGLPPVPPPAPQDQQQSQDFNPSRFQIPPQ